MRRWGSVWLLLALNAFFQGRKKREKIPISPKRILVCNIANLGDVVISTTALPVLKREFPGCEIGFLLASSATELLQQHPFVDRVHVFDHWYANRRKGVFRAIVDHLKGRSRAIKEIRQCDYELAIDLHPYFPNAIPLLFKAKIPARIGYSTGGFSNLLTESVSWSVKQISMGRRHLNLLSHLKIRAKILPCPAILQAKSQIVSFLLTISQSIWGLRIV